MRIIFFENNEIYFLSINREKYDSFLDINFIENNFINLIL